MSEPVKPHFYPEPAAQKTLDLEAIQARLAAATPGPWYAHADDLIGGWCVRTVETPPSEGPGEVASFIREEDARLIAHARVDLEALVAEVEQLRAKTRTLNALLGVP